MLPYSSEFLQHGTLWIAFVGAAIASRDNSFLKLSTGADMVRGLPGRIVGIFHGSVSIAVLVVFVGSSLVLINLERTGSGSEAYCQVIEGNAQTFPNASGILIIGLRSRPPASSSSTLTSRSSDSLAASTAPAEPAPTMT